MKKFTIIFSFILIVFISLFFLPPKEPTYQDCWEFGNCKNGEQIYINKVKQTITKDFCIKNGYKWYEENQICNIRG